MLFRKKKKEELHKGDIFLAKGIYLKQPVMDNGHNILNCFLRSIIVFLLVFGSVGGFLSAFSVSYNYMMVILAYIILSMYFSFLYSTSKLLHRDIGYIAFFLVFIFFIVKLHAYANSGFYAIINRLLKQAQSFFNLSGVRQYETRIANDYLTIAIVAIFIGMVLIIVLNIWLYSSMSVGWTLFLTFPILLIPLYMKLVPDPVYLISLGIGYFAVMIFKANGHYLAYASDAPFHIKGRRKEQITYTQDGYVFKQVLTRVFLLMFCMVIIVEALFSPGVFQSRFKKDWIRDETSETIANFVLLGFTGLYNHYSSTAGISGGKLGGVSNVRPDYQTDLVVTYTPYSNEAVYLKAYTGGLYGENEWENIYSDESVRAGQNDIEIFEEESMKEEAFSLQLDYFAGDEYSSFGTMTIRNVGADISYMYYPYYSMFSDYSQFENHGMMSTMHGIGLYEEKDYTYYPKIVWQEDLGDKIPKDMDVSSVNPIYLDVPEKNKQVIENECDIIGLSSDMTENEIVEAVREYFEANIPYTLKPGATPKNEDFINYFLTGNRKGYCAHFASAATLIFRQMGIPARYVEGYAFDFEAVLASSENKEIGYSQYYQGYSSIGKSTVMDVDVTDAMAHAWVEIYIDGFGWKVVEVTPGSNEAVEEDDFWDAFSSILNGSDIGDTTAEDIFGELNLSQYSWLIYVVLGFVMAVVLIGVLRIGIRKGVRYYRCHAGDKSIAIIAYYADLCDMVRICDKEFNACRSHTEQLVYMNLHFNGNVNVEEISQKLEEISFSSKKSDEKEIKQLYYILQQMRKAIWKYADFKQKIRFFGR